LARAALDRLGKTVLRIAGAQRESCSPLLRKGMVEQRCEPSSIVIGVDQAKSDRIGQDLRIVIYGLVERPHDRRNFDGPASLRLFHHSLKQKIALGGVNA
jgi:hypothetical protein